MMSLGHQRVFLSASFPSGTDGEPFRPYDAGAIAEAVTALAHAVLRADGQLVFGGHPTISPLILLVAGELGRHEVVEIHQSKYYCDKVPQETFDLERRGFGVLRWWDLDPTGDKDRSELIMREKMLTSGPFVAGIFIGGMDGILDEHKLFEERQPGVPRLPLWAPGGAARGLEPGPREAVERLRGWLHSPRYPAVAHEIVRALTERD
jgi:hypothetical protein